MAESRFRFVAVGPWTGKSQEAIEREIAEAADGAPIMDPEPADTEDND